MKMRESGAISLLLAILVVFAVLSYILLKGSEDGPIRERTSSDPYPFLSGAGGIPPSGSITGVVGLDASIVDSELRVDGSIPRLYVGGMFYRLYGDDGPLNLGELESLGIELSGDRPFVLVDLTIEPLQNQSGLAEGSARIVSVDHVKNLQIPTLIASIVPDFSDRTDELATEIELARLVLDPEMYNSVKTLVTCTYVRNVLRIVLDMQASYEGPLEWYIKPYHLVLATYTLSDDGEATDLTLVPPRVASGGSKALGMALLVDTGTTRAGDEIRFMVVLKNQGSTNYTAEASPPLFDLNLYTKQGVSMGSWGTGKAFPEHIERITLKPGEVLRQTMLWDLMPLDPESPLPVEMVTGSYNVAAVWVPEDLEGGKLPIWINASRPSLSLNWAKFGGFAGVNQELTISPEGGVLATNRMNSENSFLTISPDEHWKLFEALDQAGLMGLDRDHYGASSGAADFFSYELDITLRGSARKIKWVDHWAAMTPLPGALFEVGRILEDLAKQVWVNGSPMFD